MTRVEDAATAGLTEAEDCIGQSLLEQWPNRIVEDSILTRTSNMEEEKVHNEDNENDAGVTSDKMELRVSDRLGMMEEDADEHSEETMILPEQWRLKIRLVSVVDLPISLLPPPRYENGAEHDDLSSSLHVQRATSNPPLCPVFKFGLMIDSLAPKELTENELQANKTFTTVVSGGIRQRNSRNELDANKSSRTRIKRRGSGSHIRQTMVQIGDAFREGYFDRQGNETNGTEQRHTRFRSTMDSVAAGLINATTALSIADDKASTILDYCDDDEGLSQDLSVFGGITHIPNVDDVRCSVGTKVVGKSENGFAEWHEEIVWDNISLIQTKLVIELCSRTPPHIYRGGGYRESLLLRGNASPTSPSDQAKKGRESWEIEKEIGSGKVPSIDAARLGVGISNDGTSVIHNSLGNGKVSTENNTSGVWGNVKKFISKRANRDNDAQKELEEANSAARVAKYLVESSKRQSRFESSNVDDNEHESRGGSDLEEDNPTIERQSKVRDIRIGYHTVPLRRLLLAWKNDKKSLSIEKWFTIQPCIPSAYTEDNNVNKREPSFLMEIKITPSPSQKATKSEEKDVEFDTRSPIDNLQSDMHITDDISSSNCSGNVSMGFGSVYSKKERQVKSGTDQSGTDQSGSVKCLDAGVVDFVAVVGPTVTGNLLQEDVGSVGWVKATTQPSILEQFPPSDDYHWDNKRFVSLPNMCEWFCFPEGVKMWRGINPPTHSDLKSHFSFSNDTSVASFDACLNCATSFAWFLVSSSGESYGSKTVKTYAAVVRFYAPAPYGVDDTQDDFGQNVGHVDETGKRVRLWVPIGICLTSSIPIVGTLEAILLRLCESLNSRCSEWVTTSIHDELANLILNAPSPIAGILHCSLPFLSGERFHLILPPPRGLPPLPHGASISATCKLLGSDGIVTILSAVLTESKVLMHSNDSSNLAMVAEIVNALIYPFSWALPYVPVLPRQMIEFVEAPLSYIIGVPTCMLNVIDEDNLEDVVVIDLDRNHSRSDEAVDTDGWGSHGSKRPLPLPQQISQNITNAVNILLRAEEEVEEMYGAISMRVLPRLDQESLAEREFRVRIALEICGLLRGYQECLFFVTSSQPVFNRDRFLRICPALFDNDEDASSYRINSRSKRFLSTLVTTQQFQQFLERLDTEDLSFFHEVMDTFEINTSENEFIDPLPSLTKLLQAMEDDIPTYRATKLSSIQNLRKSQELFLGSLAARLSEPASENENLKKFVESNDSFAHSNIDKSGNFVRKLLLPNVSCNGSEINIENGDSIIKKISIEDYQRITDTPWLYTKVFDVLSSFDNNEDKKLFYRKLLQPLPKLQSVLGDKKFEEYRQLQEDYKQLFDNTENGKTCDLGELVIASDQNDDSTNNDSIHGNNADLESIRLCLQKAYEGGHDTKAEKPTSRRRNRKNSMFHVINFNDNGRDLVREAEFALRNPRAQKYLVNILSNRARVDSQRRRWKRHSNNAVSSSGRLVRAAFEVLVRLCHAMLEACREIQDYEGAYQLLTKTAGFYMVSIDSNSKATYEYLTENISKHPLFSKVKLWERVFLTRRNLDESSRDKDSDHGVAISILNEMGSFGLGIVELSHFATRVSQFCGWNTSNPERSRSLTFLARDIYRRKGDVHSDEGGFSSFPESDEFRSSRKEWQNLTWTHPVAKINQAAKSSLFKNTANSSIVDPHGYYGRCMITSLASFGSSLVATGAIDGSVFVASSFGFGDTKHFVQGVRLGGGISQAPINCLASVRKYAHQCISTNEADDQISALDGCYFVAGSACGTLQCWSLQDIYEQSKGNESSDSNMQVARHQCRTLTKHRGAITCLDVPSPVYRPETIISGGKDGTIRLTIIRDQESLQQDNPNFFARRRVSDDSNFAPANLLGHGGGITCLKSAWHGDRLLSGGEDTTLRLWDIGGASTGTCVLKMVDHKGWVTNASFWGEHIVVSSSTDRSVLLWDTRSGERPVTRLNYHQGPVSGLHVGSRSEAFVVTSGGEGIIATWDLRKLGKESNGIRRPITTMDHNTKYSGYTHLVRGKGLFEKSIISCGSDGILKEWDIIAGTLLDEQPCGHDDLVSCISTFDKHDNVFHASSDLPLSGGTISASWDGTVKLRRLIICE